MIIGITGLISSGKDTAADYLIRFHGFKKLSYAGPLKDCVSAIFGWVKLSEYENWRRRQCR